MNSDSAASPTATWDWSAEDLVRLTDFLEERAITRGPLRTQRIGDGHSNLTFRVTDGHRTVVVRRPPPPPIPRGAHDVLREARIMVALQDSPVPVPEVLATAAAGEVIDVPLFVMSCVDGPVVTARTPAPLDTPAVRQEIGESLVDTLAALHAVDWQGSGLGDFGRPEGYNARHLARMATLIADEGTALPPGFAELHEWLRVHCPSESAAAIVHSDFRIGNMIVADRPPGRVAAVLDWELATIGDPLHDVGYFLASCPAGDERATATVAMGLAMAEPGYPTRAELAARYSAATGRDLHDLAWYTAFAQWKLAVLYEYGRRRAVTGAGDSYYADPALVAGFLDAAERSATQLRQKDAQ